MRAAPGVPAAGLGCRCLLFTQRSPGLLSSSRGEAIWGPQGEELKATRVIVMIMGVWLAPFTARGWSLSRCLCGRGGGTGACV